MTEATKMNFTTAKGNVVDSAELQEIFADTLLTMFFDGQTLRLNFGVTRYGELSPGQTPTGTRHVCSRLVLTAGAAMELIKQMEQLGTALKQTGKGGSVEISQVGSK